METPSVSIVVTTFNEENHIEDTLKSVINQTYKPAEIIVVDSESDDDTVKISKKYTSKVLVHKLGIAEGKNLGAATAKGDLLIFLDADTIISPTFIERAVRYTKRSNVAMIGGIFRSKEQKFCCKVVANLWCNLFYEVPYKFGKVIGLVGPCTFVVKRDKFVAIGGFDTNFKIFEDVDFSRRIKKFGRIMLAKDLISLTSMRKFHKYGHLRWILYSLKLLFYYYLFSKSPKYNYPHVK